MKKLFFPLCLILLLTFVARQSAVAQDSSYCVTYGSPATPGRSYDSDNDTTTFTYTVIGKGSAPADFLNNRLKAFKVSECLPALERLTFSPDLAEGTIPEFFTGPNPDSLSAANDPVGFNFGGLIWKGWHGDATLPVLLDVDKQRSFSVTYAGAPQVTQ